MEHPLIYSVNRFGSLFCRYKFRPLILRMAWGINVLLFAAVVWAFVSCMRDLN